MTYFRRQYFKRFLGPISRLDLHPSMVGRTLVMGLLWGVSPTVGVQFIGLALCWLALDRLSGLRFNLPIAALLTTITNPLTVAPIYGFYYLVGCQMVTCSGSLDLTPFQIFGERLWALDITAAFAGLLASFTGPMGVVLVGSLPFVVGACVAGWFFGTFIGTRLSARRLSKANARNR